MYELEDIGDESVGLHGTKDPAVLLRKLLTTGRPNLPAAAPKLSDYQKTSTVRDLINVVSVVGTNRDSYFQSLGAVRESYIVKLILSTLAEDILANSSSRIRIDVNSKNAAYKRDIEELFETFGVHHIVGDIVEDLIFWGEHSLYTPVESGVGIVDIQDLYQPGQVIGIYQGTLPRAFYVRDSRGDYHFESNKNITHFVNNSQKIRLSFTPQTNSYSGSMFFGSYHEVIKELGSPVIRVGRSAIWPALDKIKELITRERILMLQEVIGLSRPQLVSVSLPPSTTDDEIITICKRYESYLNNVVKIGSGEDPLAMLDKIAETASRVKVVPGFTDKGDINKLQINEDLGTSPEDREVIVSLRQEVLECAGIPPELVFGQGEDSVRSSLKRYSRYGRKVKNFQYAISRALTMLSVKHLAYKYQNFEISESDIEITMYNPTNIDELDDLEGSELVLSNVNSIIDTVSKYSEALAVLQETEGVDASALRKVIGQILKDAGSRVADVFLTEEEREKDE